MVMMVVASVCEATGSFPAHVHGATVYSSSIIPEYGYSRCPLSESAERSDQLKFAARLSRCFGNRLRRLTLALVICSEFSLAFNRTVVLRYRIHLEECPLRPGHDQPPSRRSGRVAYEAAT